MNKNQEQINKEKQEERKIDQAFSYYHEFIESDLSDILFEYYERYGNKLTDKLPIHKITSFIYDNIDFNSVINIYENKFDDEESDDEFEYLSD